MLDQLLKAAGADLIGKEEGGGGSEERDRERESAQNIFISSVAIVLPPTLVSDAA